VATCCSEFIELDTLALFLPGKQHACSQSRDHEALSFENLRSEFVELDDLALFLPEEQAADALEDFDCDADGHISTEDLREAVLQIYENRCAPV
jgi:hypothetical protein